MITLSTLSPDNEAVTLERRADGAVIVRVHAQAGSRHRVPDAAFAFRSGDPQFSYWDDLLRQRENDAA